MKKKDTWTAANGGKRKLGAIAAPSGDPIAPTKSEPIHARQAIATRYLCPTNTRGARNPFDARTEAEIRAELGA